jgi:RimJ/RimL family protein N-acetyltransferase
MQTLRVGPLVLEPLVVAHTEDMFALLAEPELYRHLDEAPPPSVEWLQARYARWQARRSPDGQQQWLNWVIREPEGRLAGYVQATVHPDGSAWVAYVLGRSSQGCGYATVATRCMMEHLGEHFAVRRFLARVEQANEKSIAVLRRLGFSEAGSDESTRHALSATERLFVAGPGADGERSRRPGV